MKYLKWLIPVLLFSTLLTAAHAQEVTYSPYEKFDFRSDDYGVVGMTGGLLYTFKNSSDGAALEAYDDSMNNVAKVLLDFFPSKIYETHFISYADKIIVLYQALESNKVVQYAALLNDKGLLVGREIKLGTAKTGIFGATRTYFSSAVSDDKKKIVIYSATAKGSTIDFDCKVFDDQLTNIKHGHATFKADNTIEHGEVQIANDGTVYLAAYTPVGTFNYADQYWILSLAPGATKFEPKELRLDARFAASGYMKIDNVNNCIYFGGFYSNKKNGNFDGVIYASYNIATAAYQNMRFIPFDTHLVNAAGARRRNHAFDFYEVRQIIPKGDGGFVFIAEVHYVTTRNSYDPGASYYSFYSPYMSTLVHEYHYNDIMAICYDKDGGRQWDAFIPKEQYSQEDNGIFSSYTLLNSGGTLAFLFNDFNVSHSKIQLATLTADGKTDINSFTAEGNDYPDWIPRNGKQVAARELVVPCFHKKQICFAKVVF
jgi:hypothetical protein